MPEKPPKSTQKTKPSSSSKKPPQRGKKGSPGKPSERKPPPPRKKPPLKRTTPQSRQRKGARKPQSLRPTRQRKRYYQLIVNRLAGGRPEISMKLAKMLERRFSRAGWDCALNSTSSWNEFTQGVIKALRERPYALIIFGGDGSVRFAASRVARAKGLLGIVPCGRFNNIYHSLYGHTDPEEALKTLRSEYQMRIDAALANGNFFVGSLITGLLPNILDRLGSKKLPRLSITWTKIAARAADETMPRTTMMKVDAYSFKAQPLLLNIHLLSHLMTLRFAPVAVPDDGRLILVYDREGTRESVIHYLRDLKKDKYQYADSPQILRGEKISISPATGRKWLIDGDEIEFAGKEIGIEILHRILRVFSNAPDQG